MLPVSNLVFVVKPVAGRVTHAGCFQKVPVVVLDLERRGVVELERRRPWQAGRQQFAILQLLQHRPPGLLLLTDHDTALTPRTASTIRRN
jgi:hypothetical protein